MEPNQNTIFMYSGQGSQYIGMGRKLYREHPVFKHWMDKGEALLKQFTQRSMLAELYPSNKSVDSPFDELLITHPTIVITQVALTETLINEGITPDAVLGVSLGELTCAVVGGVLSLEDAVFLAVEKAKAVIATCEKGGLTAVLAPIAKYEDLLAETGVTLAGTNFDNHFVIAGSTEQLVLSESLLDEQSYNYVRLPVAHGFHSEFVDPSRAAVLCASDLVEFRPIQTPIISCTTKQVHTNSLSTDHFWHTMRGEMWFKDTFQSIHTEHNRYLDLGLFGTLAGFVKYNVKGLSRKAKMELAKPVLTPMMQNIDLERLYMKG